MAIKITDDFVFLIVNDKAKEIFNTGLFELFTLHDDGSQSLIENYKDIDMALRRRLDIGIEGGFINE